MSYEMSYSWHQGREGAYETIANTSKEALHDLYKCLHL